jgi:hypothetical protein
MKKNGTIQKRIELKTMISVTAMVEKFPNKSVIGKNNVENNYAAEVEMIIDVQHFYR